MLNYESIIDELSDIINKSNYEKRKLINDGLDCSKYFRNILGFDIFVNYLEKFNLLVDAERTLSALGESYEYMINNDLLINYLISIPRNDKVVRLEEILNSAKEKELIEITEYRGYFVEKKNLKEFIDICMELRVGPYFDANILGKDIQNDVVRIATSSLKNQREHIKRLTAALKENDKIINQDESKSTIIEITDFLFENNYNEKELIKLANKENLSLDLLKQVYEILHSSINLDDLYNILYPNNKNLYIKILYRLWSKSIDDSTFCKYYNMASELSKMRL